MEYDVDKLRSMTTKELTGFCIPDKTYKKARKEAWNLHAALGYHEPMSTLESFEEIARATELTVKTVRYYYSILYRHGIVDRMRKLGKSGKVAQLMKQYDLEKREAEFLSIALRENRIPVLANMSMTPEEKAKMLGVLEYTVKKCMTVLLKTGMIDKTSFEGSFREYKKEVFRKAKQLGIVFEYEELPSDRAKLASLSSAFDLAVIDSDILNPYMSAHEYAGRIVKSASEIRRYRDSLTEVGAYAPLSLPTIEELSKRHKKVISKSLAHWLHIGLRYFAIFASELSDDEIEMYYNNKTFKDNINIPKDTARRCRNILRKCGYL